jgi:transcriptional regulator with XRE-family HTH domain
MSETVGHPGGRLLAHYRNQHGGLSQQELATQVDCSRSMVAQIESGTRLPSSQLLSAMSQALRLNAVERAILFSLYDKVEPDQISLLPYVVAVLCLDPRLRADQVESLIHLVVREYKVATGVSEHPVTP